MNDGPTPTERIGLFTVLHPIMTVLGYLATAAGIAYACYRLTR